MQCYRKVVDWFTTQFAKTKYRCALCGKADSNPYNLCVPYEAEE